MILCQECDEEGVSKLCCRAGKTWELIPGDNGMNEKIVCYRRISVLEEMKGEKEILIYRNESK